MLRKVVLSSYRAHKFLATHRPLDSRADAIGERTAGNGPEVFRTRTRKRKPRRLRLNTSLPEFAFFSAFHDEPDGSANRPTDRPVSACVFLTYLTCESFSSTSSSACIYRNVACIISSLMSLHSFFEVISGTRKSRLMAAVWPD